MPDSQVIRVIYSSLDETCLSSIESIRSLNYGHDSLDIVFTKNFSDSTLKVQSTMKGYRLIFKEDSLDHLRLLHTNIGGESELWPAPNKKE